MSGNNDLLLGQVLGNQQAQTVMMQEILTNQRDFDKRLRRVEKQSAINGAVAGGVISVLVTAIGAGVKAKLGLGA
ncbi:MAG: hypothetical protein AB1450_13285 [Pseudomonadota bacterium]